MANCGTRRSVPVRGALVALAVVLVLVGVASPRAAHAEDIKTYEVSGEADAGASDPRAVAVDDAFAQATGDAVEDLLSKAQRAEHRAALTKEVIGRARRWVASYKVTGDETAGGRRKLTVTVRINVEALRARLVELQILTAAAEPAGPDDATGPDDGPVARPDPAEPAGARGGDPRWAGRTATLLLRTRRQDRAAATYGSAAERTVPGAAVATEAMTERGLVVKPASHAGPAPRRDGELPLSDEQARALAAASKAELAVVVGAEVSDRQPVRGVAMPMILAQAMARVVASGKDGAEAEGRGSAVVPAGEDERGAASRALDRAVAIAVTTALPVSTLAQPAAVITSDDQPLAAVDGAVWMRIHARTSWKVVSALLRHLGKQPGTTAQLRRLSPAGYLVLVSAASGPERIAAATRSVTLPAGVGALKVRTERGVITVRVEEP